MKMILLSLVMLLIAFEPAFSGKILKKLDKELKKMGLQKLQNFLAEIGTNADEIDSNKVQIDNNTMDIVNNTMGIGNNTLDIKTSANEIDSNKAHIDNIAVDVDTNADEIDSNKVHIDNIAVDVGTNTVDIATNADEIDSNKVHIDNNAVDIGTLKTNGPGSVWFDAWRTNSVDTSNVWKLITYTDVRESSSNSGAMNAGTGIFEAPLAGTYQFFIQVLSASGVDGEVKIMLDGNTMNRYVDWDQSSGGATITGTAIIKMEPGQKVWAETWKRLESYPSGLHIHFTGVLITPN